MSEVVIGADPPFIIWTMQRTGGTNLAQTLFERSSHRGVQHEPFNVERLYGEITRRFREEKDDGALHKALENVLHEQVLIKHCVEKVPSAMNAVLANVATQAGYRHIFLYRRAALGRLLSFHFALVSGVWGKSDADTKALDEDIFRRPIPVADLLKHERRCRRAMKGAFEAVKMSYSSPFLIAFEDIYCNDDREAAGKILGRLFEDLKLSRQDEDHVLLNRLRGDGAQGTRDSYRSFVNYADFAKAVRELGPLDMEDSGS